MIGLDISHDFMRVMDFLDSATLKVSGSADVWLPNCVATEPVQFKELDPTGAQVIRMGTKFVWPTSFSSQPPLGSVVVDEDGVYWTVWKGLHRQHVETREVWCLNLSIVTAAANNATVLKAVYTKGWANEAKATWYGLWSGVEGGNANDTVAARFQPSEETAKLEFGGEFAETAYRVYFESPVPVDAAGGEYRLVDSEGYRYRVVKYYNEGRIDRLPVAVAIRITEGAEYWSGPGGSGGSG
jgi:hypothetical protein